MAQGLALRAVPAVTMRPGHGTTGGLVSRDPKFLYVRSPNRPSGGLAVIVMGGAGARLAPCRGLGTGSIRRRPAPR
ncbi:hypothetical protein DEM25_002950 [Oceaniradius stylonematis]|uniref:Uncharacterized protein n=1 Tax=Oceaniradius stylonematis TaxID=2184161 RepID=A0A3A8AQU1_9HYPH|nr:hypothetical protein DEM25_002950 [Oceaniradius stylonematis]